MKLPVEMRKDLVDMDITFVEWCNSYNLKREIARNVASGIIKGTTGISKEILSLLKQDFPNVFCREHKDVNFVKENNEERLVRHDRIKSKIGLAS